MAERRGDGGSAMMLVPAGVLVLLMLAAMTFDFAHLYAAQREAADVAEGVANDAVALALDQGALRAGHGVSLTQSGVDRVAALARANPPSDLTIVSLEARLDPTAGTVTVDIVGSVEPVFLRAVPGGAVPRTVHASATARITS